MHNVRATLGGIPMQFLCRLRPSRLEFLRTAAHSYKARRETMLDLALLFVGFVLLCLFIAYERLCNRL